MPRISKRLYSCKQFLSVNIIPLGLIYTSWKDNETQFKLFYFANAFFEINI